MTFKFFASIWKFKTREILVLTLLSCNSTNFRYVRVHWTKQLELNNGLNFFYWIFTNQVTRHASRVKLFFFEKYFPGKTFYCKNFRKYFNFTILQSCNFTQTSSFISIWTQKISRDCDVSILFHSLPSLRVFLFWQFFTMIFLWFLSFPVDLSTLQDMTLESEFPTITLFLTLTICVRAFLLTSIKILLKFFLYAIFKFFTFKINFWYILKLRKTKNNF
jgi:hypothetical protein